MKEEYIEKIENKKIDKERLLYLLICVFAIISSLTVLLDFLYLRSVTKILQSFILIACFVLILNIRQKSNNLSKRNIVNILYIIIIYLLLLFIKDIIFSDVSISLIFRNFLQIFFMYFWILVAFSISKELLDKILLFIQKLFYVGILFSILEFIIPTNLKSQILSMLFGSVPVGYLSRDIDFGFMRLGSFYFNPLTLSFSLLFLLCYYKTSNNKIKGRLTFIIAFLAQTKTAIIGGILILLGKNSKFINIAILYTTLIFVFFICIYFDGWFFYYTFNGTSLKSLSNHLSGLVFGVQAAFTNIIGNGLGKSGYLLFVDSLNDPSISKLFNIIEYENGNESTYGVIGYQLGGIFLILHLFLFLKLFYFQLKNKNFSIVSFILLIILFQLFSESPLTILITFCQAFLFAKSSVEEKSILNN